MLQKKWSEISRSEVIWKSSNGLSGSEDCEPLSLQSAPPASAALMAGDTYTLSRQPVGTRTNRRWQDKASMKDKVFNNAFSASEKKNTSSSHIAHSYWGYKPSY